MPNVTIRRTWKVNGVLTSVSTAKLSDPNGTFGVKRNDTDAVVVADGVDMTEVSTGVYEYTFSAVEGVAYTAYVEFVYAGQTHHLQTSISTVPADTVAYASTADMIHRYDVRLLGDLVADDNTQVSEANLATNDVLLEHLQDASGQIEAALQVAKRYSVAELQSLTGNSRNHLIRITCDIAMAYLLQRRVSRNPEMAETQMKVAERHLEKLRQGVNVFNLEEQQEAGLPTNETMTSLDFQNLNLLRDRTRNYYPHRRLPGDV